MGSLSVRAAPATVTMRSSRAKATAPFLWRRLFCPSPPTSSSLAPSGFTRDVFPRVCPRAESEYYRTANFRTVRSVLTSAEDPEYPPGWSVASGRGHLRIEEPRGSYRGHRRILSWSQKDLISRRIRYGAVFILVGGGARLELQKIDDISYDGIRRHFPFRDITFRNGGAERPNSVSGLGCHQMPLIFRQVVDGSPDGPAELLSPDPGIGG